MSAPRTPAEMADWLDKAAGLTELPWVDEGSYCPDGDILREAAKMLRSVPTDAQKIEALHAAMSAGISGYHAMLEYYSVTGDPEIAGDEAKECASSTRTALRLLGLPTE